MANSNIAAVRGMNDILPEEIIYWQYIEKNFRELAESYCYREIRTPILESTDLFHRSIGEATDIVEKETYTFTDRNGDSLTMRPEGTAGTVRAGIEHGLLYNQVQRLWYVGPIFRHERPQKGRYRQFYQFGLEAFGMPGPDIDVELLRLIWRWWQKLNLTENVSLEINSLGLPIERQQYTKKLVEYFSRHQSQLDEDSVRRLQKNPLRILDSKNPDLQSLLAAAPNIHDYLSQTSKDHFTAICKALDGAKIPYKINPRLVRGLDYYCHTVFEWVSSNLGAQGTVCAGGRYDGLVATIGGQDVPAVGCAIGIERIILLLKQNNLILQDNPDIYIISDSIAREIALKLAENIHDVLPTLKVLNHCGTGNFKAQMKKADKSGAEIALLIGENELNFNTVSIKHLRNTTEQITVPQNKLIDSLMKIFK